MKTIACHICNPIMTPSNFMLTEEFKKLTTEQKYLYIERCGLALDSGEMDESKLHEAGISASRRCNHWERDNK